jgi:hypothetical protein
MTNEYRKKALESRKQLTGEVAESQEQQRVAEFEATHVAAEQAKQSNAFQLGESYLAYAQQSMDATYETIEANHMAMLNAFQGRLELRSQQTAKAIVQMADPRISLGRTWEIASQHFQSIEYSDIALDCGSGVAAIPVPTLPEFKGLNHLLPQGK